MCKRILTLALCFIMLFSFVACNGGDEPVATTAAETTTSPATTLGEEAKDPTPTKPTDPVEYLATVDYNKFELTGDSKPYFMGRWFEKEIGGVSHMVTVTDGSLFYFMIDGATSFDVNFTVITEKETPYFAYSIDGGTPVRQLITDKTVELPDTTLHTVRIIADCMNSSEDKWEGEKGFAFKSLTASEGGTIYGIKPKNKVIFYYGDSITEGINALGDGTQYNSATNSYAWLCSEQLGATHYSIGYSGTGITRGIEEGKSFAKFSIAIDHLSKDRLVSDGIKPDVIVINHGCNDATIGTDPEEFKANLMDGITKLKTMYPDTPIYYVVPFDQKWKIQLGVMLKNVENVTLIGTAGWATDDMYTDDNGHPSAEGAKTLAGKLAAALKEQLGADFFN